ncbi:IS30 family transposase [Limosilactobacillus reuteri]|uniref:IS30 family transposase n=2 Tax=Limosilactobacillus reuteri TaxID=1598 RepID=UPI002361C882|nr:IS30 family transposase [Limosilactobacillus reuteri]MDD1379829.1 IS30 family transposase [Limosilactobacillus reuteri]
MTYTHLTTNELTIIAHSFVQKLRAYRVAQMINRSAETVYRVYRYLETGASIADYQDHYMRNKQRCGRKRTQLSLAELTYINDKIAQGWTPDTIIGRAERPISCSLRTLYRMFERGQFGFDVRSLPMRGKRHPNGYVERRGKAGQLERSIHERAKDFPHYATEFGHLEADTVQGKKHQGTVMTLTERQSKVEIVLNVHEKTADAINQHLSQWLRKFPRHFFKSITFDNGKEFAGWREIANQFDLHTYFAEVGAPNQRGLNENNNGLLRRDGLTKQLDFRNLPDELVTQLMSKRNNLPRKSLGYRTPYEVFMSYVTDEQLFSF